MPVRVWKWLTIPPAHADVGQAQRAVLQLRVLAFLLVTIPCIFAAAMFGADNTLASNLALYGPMTAMLLAGVLVVRQGWHDVAGWLISLTIWGFVAAATLTFGGILANIAAAYVIVVMIAGAVLGPRQALFFALLSVLASGGVAWIESAGLLPDPYVPVSLLNGWIAITVTLVLAAVLHNLAIRNLDEALAGTSIALARLRETQAENETRGLHGAALARIAEQALLGPDARTCCVEAASVAASVLSVESVYLVEIGAEGSPTRVDLYGAALQGTPTVMEAPVRGRASGQGVLGVATSAVRRFSREEEQFLGTLANIIGTLFEHELATDRAQRAQKLEVLGRLAGGVVHDFNNQLSVIMATSELLRSDMGADRREALVDDLDDATAHARRLTRQLLAFSRNHVVAITRLDLAAQVRDMFPMMRRLVGDSFVLDVVVPHTPVWVDGDPGGIDQIVFNLLVNARDAMPAGGTIEVRVDESGPTRAVLSVRDSGLGMDEATQRRLFQPFFTTKDSGTGLGLAAVADLVRRHGATIEVESAPGRGTMFAVRFPVAAPEPRVDAEAAPARGKGRVLLAEDHALVRACTTQMLRSFGFDVVAVGSGREARERLTKDRAFVLLVADVSMPDGGGRQLVEDLFLDGLAMPVLFISGYLEEVPKNPMGPSHFLAKPFTRDELGAAVATCGFTGA